MKTIYKYPIFITDHQGIMMPEGATFLSVQYQGTQLYLWCLVDTNNVPKEAHVYIVGTGNPISNDVLLADFIGTAQMPDAPLVWHVFGRKT